jgi:hypothetical protein
MTHPLRWMSLIALTGAELPSFDDIARADRELFPDTAPLVASQATDSLVTLTVDDFTAAATLVPRPIPASQLEGPAATAWYWPDAAETLAGHAAHLMVTLIDEGGRPLVKALALTRLTAAIAAAAPSVGVFWGPGRLVHQPTAFVEQAQTSRPHNLPLFLWIDFRIEPAGDGSSVRLFTTGLDALGAEELEVEGYHGDPRELVGFVYNVAHYLLDRRKVINDGDTIGLTDAVQVTAHRGPSILGGDLEVLSLSFATES